MGLKREIIGIAGNIGAGKSVVSRIIRCNGFPVFDCDLEASMIMVADSGVKSGLVRILGMECYKSDGRLNKAHISSKIFNDNRLRHMVNEIVHEAVKRKFLQYSESFCGKVFVESAVMASSGLDRLCDSVWVIDAPEPVRLERVRKRSGLPDKEIRARMNSQKQELNLIPQEKVVIIENCEGSNLLVSVLGKLDPDANVSVFQTELNRKALSGC